MTKSHVSNFSGPKALLPRSARFARSPDSMDAASASRLAGVLRQLSPAPAATAELADPALGTGRPPGTASASPALAICSLAVLAGRPACRLRLSCSFHASTLAPARPSGSDPDPHAAGPHLSHTSVGHIIAQHGGTESAPWSHAIIREPHLFVTAICHDPDQFNDDHVHECVHQAPCPRDRRGFWQI